MTNYLYWLQERLAAFPDRIRAAMVSAIGRFFHARPVLKRALLALMLQQVLLVPLLALPGGGLVPPIAMLMGLMWSAFLLGLFWGMGAERAALDWDAVFNLPPARSFHFWGWHALEKRRFLGVVVALLVGLVLFAQMGGA